MFCPCSKLSNSTLFLKLKSYHPSERRVEFGPDLTGFWNLSCEPFIHSSIHLFTHLLVIHTVFGAATLQINWLCFQESTVY